MLPRGGRATTREDKLRNEPQTFSRRKAKTGPLIFRAASRAGRAQLKLEGVIVD